MKSRACLLAFVFVACGVAASGASLCAAQGGKGKDSGTARRREAIDHYNQGVTLAGKGDKQKALDEYRRAIKADPTYAIAYNNLGVLLNDRGDTAGAEAAYKSAIEHDPHLFLGYLNLGRLQYNTKQLQAAEATLSKAVGLLTPPATSALEQVASTIPANG
jgi:Flp pilus assembly protein TadD